MALIDDFLASEKNERDAMDKMHDIAARVREYVPGQLGWIARQMSDHQWTDTYGIQIGNGACFCTVDEAANADDAFIRKLAEQILGFPVDSKQDLQRRFDDASQRRHNAEAEIARLMKEAAYWNGIEVNLKNKLEGM